MIRWRGITSWIPGPTPGTCSSTIREETGRPVTTAPSGMRSQTTARTLLKQRQSQWRT